MSPANSESAFGVVVWEIQVAGNDINDRDVRAGNVELRETLDGHSSFSVECLALAAAAESSLENKVLDELHDTLGEIIEISFGVEGESSQTFKGTITEIEGRRSYEQGYAVVLSGFGPTKLIDDLPRTRTFLESSVSEVVQSVLSDRSVSVGTVDSTKDVFPILLQRDETDYEFVRRLCHECGLWFYYDGEKVHATATPSGKGGSVTLGSSLESFKLRMGVHAGKLEGTSWSYAHSDQVWAESKASDGKGDHEWQLKAHSESDRLFNRVGLVTPPFHAVDSAQLSDWFRARSEAWGASLLTGEGTSVDIGLGLGGTVEIAGAGKSGGEFVIVEIDHGMQEGRRGGYANRFRCLPRKMAHAPANPDRLGIPQVWGAKVLDNVDPDDLGRVKVVLHRSDPKGDGENGQHWVRVSQPFAGAQMGTWWLPEIDDEVVVACLEGDSHEMVCLGSLYHSKTKTVRNRVEKDVTKDEFEKNSGKLILTRSGNRILLSDADGKETIEITSPDGQNRLTLLLGDGEKDARVQIDTVGNVEITAKNQVSVHAEDIITITAKKDVSIEAEGELSLESGGDMNLKSGGNLNLEAKTNVKTKGGANVDVEGGANVGVKGSGTVEVKGAMIKLN